MDYVFLIIILLLLSWFAYRDVLKTGLTKATLIGLWGVKIAFAVVFMLINIHYFGKGVLYGDVANFFNDGLELNQYASQDFGGYLKLLIGAETDNLEIIQTHLAETKIWSFGENGDFINDNRLIIRLNSLLYFISFQNIWTHVIVFAFLSYIGTLFIFKSFAQFIIAKKAFLIGLFVFPSIGFWGSSPSKETIMVLGLGLFFYVLSKFTLKRDWKLYLIGIIALFLLLFNKPYVGLFVVALSIIVFIGYRWEFNFRTGVLASVVIVAGLVVLCFTPNRINIVDRISTKQQDMINVAHGGIFFITDSSFCAFDYQHLDNFTYHPEERLITVNSATAGEYKLFGQREFHPFTIESSEQKFEVYHIMEPSKSYIDVNPIDNSPQQLILNIPSSFVNVMLRPYPNDPGDPLKILVFIENILFIGWWIFVLFKHKKLSPIEKSWIYYLVTTAILIILLIGLTTPVLGAVVRYKLAAVLFLYISSFIIFKGKPEHS